MKQICANMGEIFGIDAGWWDGILWFVLFSGLAFATGGLELVIQSYIICYWCFFIF
jgi:hypothetical protein